MIWLAVAAALAFVVANGVFVAFEFALVTARRGRLETLAPGSRRARLALAATANLSEQIAGVQLGITIASLALGALGEPAIAHLLEGPLQALGLSEAAVRAVSFGLALGIVVFLHTVLGELVPKYLAIARAERTLLWLAVPMRAFLFVFGPVVRMLDGLARGTLRLLRVPRRDELVGAHSPEELARLLADSADRGVLEPDEHALLSQAIAFAARPVADVMIPRHDVVAVAIGAPVAEVERVLVETGHSRLPVTGRDLDDVVGFVHAKDLLSLPDDGARERPLPRPLLRRMLRVGVDRPLDQVLVTMRRSRLHLAIVLGADGRTAGLVTLEDLLEAVVGEIRDETDRPAP